MIIAHAGHWAVQLLYVAPLLVVVLALAWQRLKDRRQERAPERAPDDATVDETGGER